MAAINWEVLQDDGSMAATPLGPPRPFECPDGWMSHQWTLSIEEGQMSVQTADCPICSDGFQAHSYPEDFTMDAIPITMEWFSERTHDGDGFSYCIITPKDRTP
jgi:hypothetical protein